MRMDDCSRARGARGFDPEDRPQRGRLQPDQQPENFPHNGKSFRDFSTQWKKVFHSVEKPRRRAAAVLCCSLAAGAVWAAEPARLASDLAQEGRHEAAAIEFRRLALTDPAATNTAGWFWLAAHEYAQDGAGEQSNRMLDRAEDAAPGALPVPVAWLRAENALADRDWDAASFHFDSLRLKAGADDLREFAARGAAAARLRDRDPAGARQALAQAPGEVAAACQAVECYAGRRDKKSWVGGVLGLVPGLGYVYSGEYANAARSLILNSLFIWGMVETADDDQWGLFALVTFGEFTWYSGSIYGGIDAAHRHNQRRLDAAVDGIRGDARLAPDLAQVPLFTLKFEF